VRHSRRRPPDRERFLFSNSSEFVISSLSGGPASSRARVRAHQDRGRAPSSSFSGSRGKSSSGRAAEAAVQPHPSISSSNRCVQPPPLLLPRSLFPPTRLESVADSVLSPTPSYSFPTLSLHPRTLRLPAAPSRRFSAPRHLRPARPIHLGRLCRLRPPAETWPSLSTVAGASCAAARATWRQPARRPSASASTAA